MKLGARPPRKRLVLIVSCLAVVILCGIAAFWTVRHENRPVVSHDCGVVGQLGQQWNAMVASINAQENGPGERSDLIAMADDRSAMSQKISDAAKHVSSSTLRDSLNKWAEGSTLSAKVQRDAAGDSPESTAHADEDSSHAAVEVYQATSALKQACPNMPQDPSHVMQIP